MKKMIVIILVLIALATVFFALRAENVMTKETYTSKYYELMSELNNKLEEGLLHSGLTMLQYDEFQAVYNHEGMLHEIDRLRAFLDTCLMHFEALGPQLQDEAIQKYQSRLESSLYQIRNKLIDFRENPDMDVLAVNQYTLYDEFYKLLLALEPDYKKMHINAYAIEELLPLGEKAYYVHRIENNKRFLYLYAILGTRVAMYQDYTGLNTSPARPHLLGNHMVEELSSSVMIPIVEALESWQNEHEMYENQLIGKAIMAPTDYYFKRYVQNYKDYAEIRYLFKDDFFKSGAYKEYQTLVHYPNFSRYEFDVETYPEIGFNQMYRCYVNFYVDIYEQPHLNYMNY